MCVRNSRETLDQAEVVDDLAALLLGMLLGTVTACQLRSVSSYLPRIGYFYSKGNLGMSYALTCSGVASSPQVTYEGSAMSDGVEYKTAGLGTYNVGRHIDWFDG